MNLVNLSDYSHCLKRFSDELLLWRKARVKKLLKIKDPQKACQQGWHADLTLPPALRTADC